MDEFEGGFLQSSPKHEYSGIKTLRCLTNKQINGTSADSSSSILIVDKVEVTNIQICGYVVSIKRTSTGLLFEVDDTTSRMLCTLWINGPFEETVAELIKENSLLKITGSVKIFANKRSVNVSSVDVIDTNTLMHHLTSCVYQHLHFTNRLEKTEERRESIGFSRIQSDILEVYKNNQDEEGLDVEVVVSMLRDKYNERDIRNNVEGLLNGCHLYSVDGTSYRTTI